MPFPGISGAPLLIKPPSGIRVQDVFNVSLWAGTGAARTITTGLDSTLGSLVWAKGRSAATDNVLVDSVRSAGNYLVSNSTAASTSNAQSVSSFSPSGYSLGTFSSVNNSSQTYVGWQFRRAEEFFDIVQYTGNGVSGRQIAHNLGVVPGMVVIKRLDSATGWFVSHRSYSSAGDYQRLETTDPVNNVSGIFGTHSSSIFSIGNNAGVNASGGTYIAYLFAHDPSPNGVIQCGSYVGNGSATGPVVNLGWGPQYLMIKNATATGNWRLYDQVRSTKNTLYANLSDAEFVDSIDIVTFGASGFQPRVSGSDVNSSGQTYIYMAIREA